MKFLSRLRGVFGRAVSKAQPEDWLWPPGARPASPGASPPCARQGVKPHRSSLKAAPWEWRGRASAAKPLKATGAPSAAVNRRNLIDFRAGLGIEDVAKSSFEGVFREVFSPWSPLNWPVIIHLQCAISLERAHEQERRRETAVHLIDCFFTPLKVIRSLIRVSMDFWGNL